ncbi:MAG TPA: hypothetical protein VMT63_04835 [Bacteroidales bacterium]|nr:hypothetical protein [Bacteroidales bacterium]
MKQKIYILGLITSALIILGTLFKINHWPLAGIMIAVGMVTMVFVFLPVALVNHYKNDGNRQNLFLYLVIWLTSAVIFIGMLFKIQHWPGAGYALLLALPFPYVIFIPVFLAVTSKIKNFNIYNTVFVLLLLAVISVFSMLLALDVSKDRIYDSLDLGAKYIKVSKVLDQNPVSTVNPDLTKDIDEVVGVIEDYETRILKRDGTTKEEWNTDTKVLNYPLSIDVTLKGIYPGKFTQVETTLEVKLRKLINDFAADPGYKDLALAAPKILDFSETAIPGEWTEGIFLLQGQAWTLVYFEGLKANLKLLRATL